MGGKSSSTQDSTQTTTPYGPAQGSLQGIFSGLQGINPNLSGNQSDALNQIESYAKNFGNQFQPNINNVVNTAFAGGGPDRTGMATDAYNTYQTNLAPTINGDYLDPNKNPFFAQTTQTIGNDVTNRLAGMYAGAGRDPSGSGGFGYNLARGIAEGTAPVFANQYNTERGNQLGAMNNQFGAGTSTTGLLSGLDQQRFGNQMQGIGAATQAQNSAISPWNAVLQAESQKTGIPLGILSQIAGIAGPLGAQFGTTNSHSQGTQQMSGAQQFAMLAQGLGGLMPKGPIVGNSISFGGGGAA